MKIYELEINGFNPGEPIAYVPADSDVGFSLNIKGKENLVPTGVFDSKEDIIEPEGYLDEAQTIPFYKIHTLPEDNIEKFHVEYTIENSEGEQVAMDFYVSINSTKSGFSYVASVGGGKEPDVDKAYVDENLALKQDKLTEENAGENVTITDENGVKKINATQPDISNLQTKLTSVNQGDNVTITGEGASLRISATDTKPDVDKSYVNTELGKKQDKLTTDNAGENITIEGEGKNLKISAAKTDISGLQTKLTSANQGDNVTISGEGSSLRISATDTKPDVNKAYVDENLALKQDKLTEANAGWGLDISSDADVVKINNYGSSFYKGAPAELITKTRVGEELTGTYKIKIDPRYTYYSTKFGVDGREIANCVWNFEIDESLFPQAEKYRSVVPVIWVNLGGAPVPSQYFKSGQQIKLPSNYIWVGEPIETLTVERGKCYMFALTKVDNYWVINKQFEYQINVQ